MSEDSDETLAEDPIEAGAPDSVVDGVADSGDATEESAASDAAAEPAKADKSPKATKAEGTDSPKARKAKADAAVADRQVVARRTVTSRRVTPKGGAPAAPTSPSKARDAKKTESVVTRAPAVSPQQVYSKGPSPWWVPAIMFGLLIIGALIIMSNYMGVFGDASNVRLVIGLGFILGGIVTATQYR